MAALHVPSRTRTRGRSAFLFLRSRVFFCSVFSASFFSFFAFGSGVAVYDAPKCVLGCCLVSWAREGRAVPGGDHPVSDELAQA